MFVSGNRYSTTMMQNKTVCASTVVPKKKEEYQIVLLDGMCKHSHRTNSVQLVSSSICNYRHEFQLRT